ncbi:hypothetical protein OE88DRAFT_1647540 [Heliocybe sulcata]|uniref:Uncharacterized protein n=1 Tax=Heliocybe sulcata TaxID=5364 RepID=A0A5C3MSA1_9AGAM|nr:hypothetical protein OE88DRAFT_1647540 [Heliocybe sulcata]
MPFSGRSTSAPPVSVRESGFTSVSSPSPAWQTQMKGLLCDSGQLASCNFDFDPPRLVSISYPLTLAGNLILPSALAKYLKKYDVLYPHCMCNVRCRCIHCRGGVNKGSVLEGDNLLTWFYDESFYSSSYTPSSGAESFATAAAVDSLSAASSADSFTTALSADSLAASSSAGFFTALSASSPGSSPAGQKPGPVTQLPWDQDRLFEQGLGLAPKPEPPSLLLSPPYAVAVL